MSDALASPDQPSATIRRVNTGRPERRILTSSVALVVPSSELESFRGPFVGAPLQGALSVVSAAHLQPVLLMDDGRDRGPLLHYLCDGHVDAAVVVLLHESELLFKALADVPCPVVYIGRSTAELGEDRFWVDADHYGGGRLATRTLLEAGRRRMVTITGPLTYLPAQQRLDGFLDELADWGLQPLGVAHGDFHMQSGSMAMANLIHQAPDADGLFAGSDLMAAGALRVLKAAGRSVPQDVALVGFDDTVVAATSAPPLTSVNQPLRQMGMQAAELALQALGGGITEPRQIVLPTTLTWRESV